MAEFAYFLTTTEMRAFLCKAFNDGYAIQVIKHLPTSAPAICDTIKAIDAALAQGEHAFLFTRSDISRYPVHIKSFMRDDVMLWTPRTRVGGPCIEIYSAALYEKDGKHIVPCSTIAYHSTILHPETDQYEQAGDAIKKEFNALIAPLRKSAKKVKSIKRTAYVSPGVMLLLESGYVLATPFNGYKVG